MQRAKYNLENEYSVVGVHEEIEKTLKVLEAYVPLFFKNAIEVLIQRIQNCRKVKCMLLIQVFNYKGEKNNQEEFHVNAQPIYPMLIGKDRKDLEDKLPLEMEFYEFAKRRFFMQYSKIGGHQSKDDGVENPEIDEEN